MKAWLKQRLPKPLHHLYNRVVSRVRIRRRHGSWFDLEWKKRAPRLDDRGWVDAYDQSWDNWAGSDLSPDDITRLRERIQPGGTLLDAGCGDGFLLDALRDLAGRTAGVDISGAGLKLARERLSDAQPLLVQGFLEALPFADNSFDTIVCTHVLEHVRDLRASVNELRRICLRQLLLLVPCQEYLPYTEDYHLHFFPDEQAFLDACTIDGATCERFTVPEGVCAYSGDILLLTADLR